MSTYISIRQSDKSARSDGTAGKSDGAAAANDVLDNVPSGIPVQ